LYVFYQNENCIIIHNGFFIFFSFKKTFYSGFMSSALNDLFIAGFEQIETSRVVDAGTQGGFDIASKS
jgi:hypothetical protein